MNSEPILFYTRSVSGRPSHDVVPAVKQPTALITRRYIHWTVKSFHTFQRNNLLSSKVSLDNTLIIHFHKKFWIMHSSTKDLNKRRAEKINALLKTKSFTNSWKIGQRCFSRESKTCIYAKKCLQTVSYPNICDICSSLMKILKTFLQNKLHFQSVHSGNSEMLRKLSLAQNDSRYFAQSLFLLDLLDTIQYYLIIITSIPFVEIIYYS